jgi:hypothetical protein
MSYSTNLKDIQNGARVKARLLQVIGRTDAADEDRLCVLLGVESGGSL